MRLQTAEVNAAKRLLRGAGWPTGTRPSLRGATGWERLLKDLGGVSELPTHVRLHYAVWQQAGAQVRALDQQLGELARVHHDDVRRLETVPGVGPIVALTAIAVFADVQRLASAKHVASYAGLVPNTFQSGACDRHGHITKRGSAELRTMLCEAAHHARRPSHPLHPYFLKLCARRGYKLAVVAVAHRLCRVLWALLRDRTDFQLARLGVEEGPFTQTITASFASPRNRPAASRAPDMRWRSLLRVHDGACDPVLPRGPRAQGTVWGQALHIAKWGDLDPEWTTGDDAGDRRHVRLDPTQVTAPDTTGDPP